MKYLFIFLYGLIIFIIAVSLGAKNDQLITFNYLLSQNEYRISTLLAMAFTAGSIVNSLIFGFFYIRLRFSLVKAKRKIKYLEKKLL